MTPDTELYQRVRRLLSAEARLFGSSSEHALTLALDGVLASINPAAPDRSMFNWVIPESTPALLAAYDELARRYVQAGVRAWTVWADEDDLSLHRELSARGHALDAMPRAMAADIASLSLAATTQLNWRETDDFSTIAAINDLAYGFPPPAFSAALMRGVAGWHAYLAYQGDRALGCALSHEAADGDCGISGVATLPEARGSGIASGLLAVALGEAQRRGAVTTTLQATSKGAPVYARMGYRDLGAMHMWEHRTPRLAAP